MSMAVGLTIASGRPQGNLRQRQQHSATAEIAHWKKHSTVPGNIILISKVMDERGLAIYYSKLPNLEEGGVMVEQIYLNVIRKFENRSTRGAHIIAMPTYGYEVRLIASAGTRWEFPSFRYGSLGYKEAESHVPCEAQELL